jgi:hypothetical protein
MTVVVLDVLVSLSFRGYASNRTYIHGTSESRLECRALQVRLSRAMGIICHIIHSQRSEAWHEHNFMIQRRVVI